ncbi:TPA: hypothetical protein ACJ2UH_001402 [Yersinia enterocolitica]|nr:hypothetical protein [Yersinia enterocolitica]HDV7165296.1 hypothetical protein [Yersinia enterocolitica]HDW8037007.1 hypothetical protein [Yersinia enterocolitica]
MSELNNELKTTVETKYTNGIPSSVIVRTSGTLSNGEPFFASSSHYPRPKSPAGIIRFSLSPEFIEAYNSHGALFQQAKEEISTLSSANIEREDATTIDSITIYSHEGPVGSIKT